MSVTHVAGPVVTIAGRSIQRCACCGEKLLDNLREMAPVGPDGEPAQFLHWPEAGLVRFEDVTKEQERLQLTSRKHLGDFQGSDPLPDDFCLSLVEE